ncbi:MAG TPA: hypothetical protein VJ904_14755 [Tichowtungia sp.]|nr:hypothetical protein [Tichowtungia sp.]
MKKAIAAILIIATVAAAQSQGFGFGDIIRWNLVRSSDTNVFTKTDFSNTEAGAGTNLTYTANGTNFVLTLVFTNGLYQMQLVEQE